LGKTGNSEHKIENLIGVNSGCPNCNFENKPDSKFCESCGTQL